MKKVKMKVVSKANCRITGLSENKIYNVYNIKNNKRSDCPEFLIYTDKEEWRYCLSCWFKPIEE